jgi:hypothetical protein
MSLSRLSKQDALSTYLASTNLYRSVSSAASLEQHVLGTDCRSCFPGAYQGAGGGEKWQRGAVKCDRVFGNGDRCPAHWRLAQRSAEAWRSEAISRRAPLTLCRPVTPLDPTPRLGYSTEMKLVRFRLLAGGVRALKASHSVASRTIGDAAADRGTARRASRRRCGQPPLQRASERRLLPPQESTSRGIRPQDITERGTRKPAIAAVRRLTGLYGAVIRGGYPRADART